MSDDLFHYRGMGDLNSFKLEGFSDPEAELFTRAVGKPFAWRGLINVPDTDTTLLSATREDDGRWKCELGNGMTVYVSLHLPVVADT